MQVDPGPAFEWLTRRWREFYRSHPLPPPERFARREFGFIFYGQKFFVRHTGFRSRQALQKFMVARAPAHAYYSTAYYDRPDAPRMVDKGWRGAELIFDLDADHVPGSEQLPYEQQLAKVKVHFERLVDEFLMADFGFAQSDIVLTFSGGRGYHAHVVAERALQLTAPERREIVDYITGTRLRLDHHFRKKSYAPKQFGSRRIPRFGMVFDDAQGAGWSARISRSFARYVEHLQALDAEKLDTALQQLSGVGPKRAQLLAKFFRRLDVDRVRSGNLVLGEVIESEAIRNVVTGAISDQVMPLAKGETDEPVTSDTKRLIRLPGSLHGKTGLKVVVLSRSELDSFNPLHDAVALGDEPVRVDVVRPVAFSLMGESYDLAPGDSVRIPEAAAAMAMARGAVLPSEEPLSLSR